MLLLSLFPPLDPGLAALIDALLITAISMPVLYVFLFRPLLRHMSERRSAEEELQGANAELVEEVQMRQRIQLDLSRIQAAVEDASDAIVITGLDGKVLYVNLAFGYTFQQTVESANEAGLDSIFVAPEFFRKTLEAVLAGDNQNTEVEMRCRDGAHSPFLFRATAIMGEELDTIGALFIFTDITERKRLEEELRRIATRDALTSLANRRSFDLNIEREWLRAMRGRSAIAVLMIDIDYFKAYNDQYGHVEGDECLRRVGGALKGVLRRPADTLSRYGGEEFVGLLPEMLLNGAQLMGWRMVAEIEGLNISHSASEVSEWVTVSIGVASMIPEQGQAPEVLIRQADEALYQAKGLGRNRVCDSQGVTSPEGES